MSDEMYTICDGDENLQRHLEDYGYKVQQCTNHFVKTSMYYLWKEQYPKEERMRIKKEINGIISALIVNIMAYTEMSFSRPNVQNCHITGFQAPPRGTTWQAGRIPRHP
jgi:hypothetical protein